jgi:L-lactate dehydrogenase
MQKVVDVPDVTLALPHIVGAEGVRGTLPLPLNEAEEADLQASAKVIKTAIEEIEGSL